MLKKLLVFTLVFIFLLPTISTTSASENMVESDIRVQDLPRISEEEYINQLAELKNISTEEAYEINQKHNYQYLNELAERIYVANKTNNYTLSTSGGELYEFAKYDGLTLEEIKEELEPYSFSYHELVGTQTYPSNSDFSASVIATLKLYRSGSFGEITELMGDVWSRRESGLHEYDWVGGSHWSDPSSFPTTEVTIGATGYFVVEVDVSGGVSIDLPGFSLQGTVGTTHIYHSNNMTITRSFSSM